MGGANSSNKQVAATKRETHVTDPRIVNFVKNLYKSDSATIQKTVFVQYLPTDVQEFTSRLFDSFLLNSPSTPPGELTREVLSFSLNKLLTYTSLSAQAEFYFRLYKSAENSNTDANDIYECVKTAFLLYLSICHIAQPDLQDEEIRHSLDSIAKSISNQPITSDVSWIDKHCPELMLGMHLWLFESITCGNKELSDSSYESMELPSGSLLNPVWWWLLSSSLPSCFTMPAASKPAAIDQPQSNLHDKQMWSFLYSSREHGLSTNRFCHHVFAYKKPTVVLISCEGGHLYAVAADTEWRDGTTSWGGQNCHVIQLRPSYKILEDGENMIIFNDKSRNIPKGLFVGRNSKSYILKIVDSFQSVEHPGGKGNIMDIEVWGCGGISAKEEQNKQKKRQLNDAAKNAKVKLPGEWEENPDRLLLQWGGVKPSYGDQKRMEFSPDSKS